MDFELEILNSKAWVSVEVAEAVAKNQFDQNHQIHSPVAEAKVAESYQNLHDFDPKF